MQIYKKLKFSKFWTKEGGSADLQKETFETFETFETRQTIFDPTSKPLTPVRVLDGAFQTKLL